MQYVIAANLKNRGPFIWILLFSIQLVWAISSTAYAEDEDDLFHKNTINSVGVVDTTKPAEAQKIRDNANNICAINKNIGADIALCDRCLANGFGEKISNMEQQNVSCSEQGTYGEFIWYGVLMGICKRVENNVYYNVVPYVAGIVGNNLNTQLAWPTKVVEFLDAKIIGRFSATRLEEMNTKFSQFKNEFVFTFIGVPIGKGLAEFLWYKSAQRVQAVIVCEEVANVVSLVLGKYFLQYLPEGQDVWFGVFINKEKILATSTMASIGLCLYGYRFIDMTEVGMFAAGGLLI